MKRHILKGIIKLKRMFGFNPQSINIDMDSIIEENMNLMKEIRMHRIRFYKFYNKAQTYFH